jgi:hypothetical protein
MEIATERSIRMTTKENAESAPKNDPLIKRFAEVELADRAAEALKLELDGKRHEASQLLEKSLYANSPNIGSDIENYYRGMSSRMKKGMDEADRKRSHSEAYKRKQRREQ